MGTGDHATEEPTPPTPAARPTPPTGPGRDGAGRSHSSVASAFAREAAVPPRRCGRCRTVTATLSPTCPACGTRYDRRLAWITPRAWGAVAAVALLTAAGAAAVLGPRIADGKAERAAAAERSRGRLVAAETARQRREQVPRRGAAADLRDRLARSRPPRTQIRARRALVAAMRTSILADIAARVRAGELGGSPPSRVICSPLERRLDGTGADPTEDLSLRWARLDCLAVQREAVRGDGEVVGHLGHPVIATADFGTATYVWCKDNRRPGEAGRALAVVPLARVCTHAEGAARVGNGYARTSAGW